MPKWEHNSKICCLKAGLCKRNRQNWQKPPSIAAIKLQQEGVSRCKFFMPVIMDRLIVPVRVRIASMVGYARKHDSAVTVPVRARIASCRAYQAIMSSKVTVPVRARIASNLTVSNKDVAKVTVPVRARIASCHRLVEIVRS